MTWVPRLPEKRAAPVRCLAGRGVARITRAGTMSHTLRGEAHGGEYPLHRYVRLEKRANKTEMQAAPGTQHRPIAIPLQQLTRHKLLRTP